MNARILNRARHWVLLLGVYTCNGASGQPNIQYRVVYNVYAPDSLHKDNYEIFSVDMKGRDRKNISNLPGVEWTYYSYRDRLYYVSDKDTCRRCYFLYEMDGDGLNSRRVSDLQLEDSWMSSRNQGSELIVSGRIGKAIRYQLFSIETRSGLYKQLTNDTVAKYLDPVFSPDGRQVAFAYKRNKRDTADHEELYIMDSDGTKMRQLTHYPVSDLSVQQHQYKAGGTRWHPKENFLSYISFQNGKSNILGVTPDGSRQWLITETKASDGWHDWSSDGNWIVFDSKEPGTEQFHIVLMNWQTKEVKMLTDGTYKYQLSPVFVGID